MEWIDWRIWDFWWVWPVVYIHLWAINKVLDSSIWWNNWKHKKRFRKSDYTLSSKDVVIKGK